MRTSPTAPLLVAALVMLRHPCARNQATARLLLQRAADHIELTCAEREACLNLADDLEGERPAEMSTRMRPARKSLAGVTPAFTACVPPASPLERPGPFRADFPQSF